MIHSESDPLSRAGAGLSRLSIMEWRSVAGTRRQGQGLWASLLGSSSTLVSYRSIMPTGAATTAVGYGLGWRHVQVIILFLAACTAITTRVCLSMAVVVMTGPDNGDGHERFKWERTEKSTVLGSFLWGYMTTQVLGGTLTARGRSTRMLAGSLFVSGILTAALPLVAVAGGSLAVTAIRIVTGSIQGLCYPTIYTIVARWVPITERSRVGSLILASQPVGNVLSLGLSGVVAEAWGWPSIFYVFGLGCIAASILLLVFSFDWPEKHPWISQAEREYLAKNIPTKPLTRLVVPWRAMVTSLALWMATAGHVGYLWGYWVIVACTPSYLNNLLDIGIIGNGLLSAVPHLSMMIGSIIFGWLGDRVESKRLLSTTNNRKLFNSIGGFGPCILCILIAALGPSNPTLAVGLLVLSGGLISATFAGALIAFVDIAPNFSGINFGLGNTIGSFISAFAPYAEGIFVDKDDPMPGWSNVFYSTAVWYFVLNTVFLLRGTSEVQPWNNPKPVPDAECVQSEVRSERQMPETDATSKDKNGYKNSGFDGEE